MVRKADRTDQAGIAPPHPSQGRRGRASVLPDSAFGRIERPGSRRVRIAINQGEMIMSAVAEKLDDIQARLEKTGAAFTTEKMLAVRDVTRAAIHEIASRCKPGMVEEDAVEMAKEILASHGMVQGWHDVYVRFGTNTTKTFGAPSERGVVLGDDDLFLIDIGPVFEKWEGD